MYTVYHTLYNTRIYDISYNKIVGYSSRWILGTTSELPLIGITNHQNYQLLELPPINVGNTNVGNSEVFDRNFHSYHLTLSIRMNNI